MGFLIFAPQTTCTEQGHTGSQSLPRSLFENFSKSITHRADVRFADCFDLFFREIPAKKLSNDCIDIFGSAISLGQAKLTLSYAQSCELALPPRVAAAERIGK